MFCKTTCFKLVHLKRDSPKMFHEARAEKEHWVQQKNFTRKFTFPLKFSQGCSSLCPSGEQPSAPTDFPLGMFCTTQLTRVAHQTDTPLAKDKEPQEELEGMLQGMQIFLNTQQQSPLVGPQPNPSVPSRVAQASMQGQGDLQKEAESSGSAARKPAGAAGGRVAPRGRARFPQAVLPSLRWAFVTSPHCLRI